MKRRKKKRLQVSFRRKKPSPELLRALDRTDNLLQEERYDEVIALLEPFQEEQPHAPDFYITLGMSYAKIGDTFSAINQFETAVSQRKDAYLFGMLGSLYSYHGLPALSLDAYRQAVKLGVDSDEMPGMQEDMARFSRRLRGLANYLGEPVKKVSEGARLMERAQLAFERGDYAKAIQLNQRARRYLGDFPAVDNNLSLYYFFAGEPERAIEIARQVQQRAPDNIQALSNLVRFLSWTGRKAEAAQVWAQLRPLEPFDLITKVKKAEAAAVMEDDEMVYQTLSDVDVEEDEMESPELLARAQFLRTVAEANTGRISQAREGFELLGGDTSPLKVYLEALDAGRPGPGLADRFPYFTLADLMSPAALQAFFSLLDQEEEMPAEEFRRQVDDYLRRYPQLLLVGEKFLWQFGEPELGIDFLSALATPEAYAMLRAFATGKKGSEQDRMLALQALLFAGEISETDEIRFWRNGEWTTVQSHLRVLNPDREWEYDPPEVMELLEQGLIAFKEDRFDEAEEAFEGILELNPNVREAYNNLGALYARQGKLDEARVMLEKCIEIDSLYVFPRSNLAAFLLDEGKIDEAIAIIKPVIDLPEYHPLEMVSLLVAQARIQIALGDFETAEQMLETASDIDPDSPTVEAVRARLMLARATEGFGAAFDRLRERARAYRKRQRKLSTPDPTLAEALSLYTKELLTAIARNVAPEGGWSKYRKAELLDFLVERLQDEDVQARVLASLPPEALAAFEQVQAQGGVMAWDAFDEAYGNDLDDSPYWQYHEPESIMGTLRSHGLLFEVDTPDGLFLSIPVELRRARPSKIEGNYTPTLS